jgi:Calcium binding
LLRPLKPDLFAVQLDDWLRDPSLWPQDRNTAVFNQWFALEVHSMVLDLVEDPIMREGDEDFYDDLEQDLRIAAVLTLVTDEDNDEKALQAWKSHLEARLSFPFEGQIVEPQAHGEIKPGDTVSVFDLAGVDDKFGILVSVKTECKRFDLTLRDLEVCDEESPNYQLDDDYAVWFTNR